MIPLRPRPWSAIAALAACLSLPAMSFAAGPDFDAVTWQPLGCDSPDMIVGASPNAVSFAGNQANLPAFYAYDANYLYFRYRMDSDPRQGGSGFQQFVWTALMQVPSGNRFQYQYQLSLNGKGNTVEIWQNTVASDIQFPHFQDDAEVKLYSAPVGSLARAVSAGTSFNGNADWFVDFAFPVQTMIANGVISSAADLGQSFFFPATSTNPNNYSKSYLNCPFQPYTELAIQKTIAPGAAPANAVTRVTYTIDVQNAMGQAVGVVIQDVPLPAFFSNVTASATSPDDPGAVLTVVSTNPLQVTSPTLGAGKHVTVQFSADAAPGCSDTDFLNTAAAYATNALKQVSEPPVTLDVSPPNGPELCDGKDNNCNGQIDEGGNSLCDDGNVCTVDTCGGLNGCSHEWNPGCVPCQTAADCDDGNSCNGVETCDPATGCHAGTPLSCDDGNVCNGVETCDPKTGCQAGTSLACDDGNACNGVETCDPKTGCHAGTPLACDDGNACNGVETCDPATGCHAGTPLACDDGNACNGVETCDPKTGCHTGTPLACDDGNACNGVETCDPKTGCHTGTPLACDDGNVCNGVETCDPATGCHAGTPLSCDDGNACNGIETCDPKTGCHVGTPLACDDGNACNGVETCDPATGCHAGTPLTCGHGNTCTLETGCTPCTTATQCDDGDQCTTDTCDSSVCGSFLVEDCKRCTTAADCDDSNACNGVETCDPKTGCHAGTPLACDDGNACDGVETCDPATGCHAGTPPTCDDGNACNGVETCDPATGCHAGTPLSCDDGNVCNGGETCDPKTGCHAGTPLACDDGNACNGGETCDPKTGCHAGTPLACDDGNACNGGETCDPATGCHAGTPLVCGHGNTCTVETGCAHCSTATQCDDGDACTTDVCDSSVCGSFVVAGCKHCTTAADCDDGNTCTTETCDAGVCGHKTVENCTPCTTAADCDDSNPCTRDACGASGSCELTTIEGCERCTTATDCASDGDACTVETCSGGMCTRPTLPGCKSCTTASDCNDGDTCTTETCDGGVCGHRGVAGCKPCTTTTECNDSNPCTSDVCSASGSCELTSIAGCRRCTTAADCDDGNTCTTDVCAAGVCQAHPIAGCGVELCNDGIDNDGDGKIDCQDEDCAKDPACAPAPVEICGDCIDNDGDGLVDYEDPDCCGTTDALTLRRMAMRMRPGPGRNTLRLRGRYAALQTRTFNPAGDGVTLQISDHSGQVYCHDIPVDSKPRWLKHGVFRFSDKTGTVASGLRRVRIKIRKDGRVVVRAVGRKMSYRTPTGTDLMVTLRVGNQCLQAPLTPRSGKAKVGTRITFP